MSGSCGLTYSLVRVPQYGESSTDYTTCKFLEFYSSQTGITQPNPAIPRSWILTCPFPADLLYIVVVLLALYILATWLFPRSYSRTQTSYTPHTPGSGGGGRGWGRGGGPNSSNDAPPPYTKHASSQNTRNQPWSPGFWTGTRRYILSLSRSLIHPISI